MKKLLIVSLLTVFSTYIWGQNSNTDSITVKVKQYEIVEQDLPLFGKQKIITGTLIVLKDKKEIASHSFLIPLMEKPISHIAVYDSNNKRIEPRIHYQKNENCFTYYEGTEKEGKIKIEKNLSQKDLVLFGLWVWAKQIYQ
jgi:hypothetical protein